MIKWKSLACIGFPGYEVHEDSRIRGVHTNIVLKEFHNIKGYLRVSLYKDLPGQVEDTKKHCLVHRVTALVWVPNPLVKTIVNHDDEDILFNHRINLSWLTPSENVKYSIDNKRRELKLNSPF